MCIKKPISLILVGLLISINTFAYNFLHTITINLTNNGAPFTPNSGVMKVTPASDTTPDTQPLFTCNGQPVAIGQPIPVYKGSTIHCTITPKTLPTTDLEEAGYLSIMVPFTYNKETCRQFYRVDNLSVDTNATVSASVTCNFNTQHSTPNQTCIPPGDSGPITFMTVAAECP